MKLILILILITLLILSGCSILSPKATPFTCTSTDPQVCAVEKMQYDLDARMQAYNSCIFIHGPDPILCRL